MIESIAADAAWYGGRAIDAKRTLNDLLVNFRRIVHRGLVNYSGELWYREGLPSDVFRRLVVRKENETPLDRFSGDYEELMTYANFRDLADIIVGNDVLKERLTVLEPRDGASLLDRLHELEEMRRAAASGSPISDREEANLARYFDEFRNAVKRGSRPTDDPKPPAPPRVPKPAPPTADEETLESIFDDDEPPAAKQPSRRGRLVVKVSSGGLRDGSGATDQATVAPRRAPPAATSVSVTDEVGSVETPVTDVSSRPGGGDDEGGLIDELEKIERALRDGDDAAVLKALHVEVTEIADGMLRRDPKQGHLVWQLAGRHGWFDRCKDKYALQPLENFYRLADDFLEAFSSDAKSSDLKNMLSGAGFSRLLLDMREMFMASRGKS